MDSGHLTAEQCEILQRQLAPSQRYLHHLLERIRQQAWPKEDKVRQLVETAHNAVFALNVELHYLSQDHGVGRPPKRTKG